MKKLFSTLVAVLFCSMVANATDLWEGSQVVTWDNTVTIDASAFADMQVGQKIVFEFTVQNEDVIELHSNGAKLTGTRYHELYTDNTSCEVFATLGIVDMLKTYGLEVCGTGFTLSKVWYGDGKKNVSDNTIWTGYFWMDSWSTMELWKESLPYSFDGYKAIRFYNEANRTDYVINVMSSWDGADKIAGQSDMTMTNEYAELDLTKLTATQKELFYKSDRLMIQCNKESGNAFNFTGIELVPYYITYYNSSSSSVQVPSGYTAYTATKKDDSTILLQETDGIIPSNQAVVIKGNNSDACTPNETSKETTSTDLYNKNLLKGVADRTLLSDITSSNYVYVLSYTAAEGTAFYKYATTNYLPAGKCYIDLGTTSAKAVKFEFEDTTTGINKAENAELEKENAPIYNLADMRVNSDYKGIVIKNGKKYLNK